MTEVTSSSTFKPTSLSSLFFNTDSKLEAFNVAIVTLPSILSQMTKLQGSNIPASRSTSSDSNAEGG